MADVSEDLLGLIRVDPNRSGRSRWKRQRVLRLQADLSPSVNHGAGVHLNSHCGHERALELIRVDEQGHGGHCEGVASSACDGEPGGVLDHVGGALGIRDVDGEAWVVDLDEVGQGKLEMTVLRLVEAESMVDWSHLWHNIVLLCDCGVLVVHQDENTDLSWSDDVSACLDVWSKTSFTSSQELK